MRVLNHLGAATTCPKNGGFSAKIWPVESGNIRSDPLTDEQKPVDPFGILEVNLIDQDYINIVSQKLWC